MKFTLILLFTASCFGQTIQERVQKFENPKSFEVEFDKFRKVTTVRYDLIVKSAKKGLWATTGNLFYIYLTLPENEEAGFVLMSSSSRPSYHAYCPPLRFLLNEKLMEIFNDECSAGFTLTADHIDRIVNAKIVEFQLSAFEGKIDDKALKGLKNLHSLTKPPPR